MKAGSDPIVVYSVYQSFRDMRSAQVTASFSELPLVELKGDVSLGIRGREVPSIFMASLHSGYWEQPQNRAPLLPPLRACLMRMEDPHSGQEGVFISVFSICNYWLSRSGKTSNGLHP